MYFFLNYFYFIDVLFFVYGLCIWNVIKYVYVYYVYFIKLKIELKGKYYEKFFFIDLIFEMYDYFNYCFWFICFIDMYMCM